MSEIDIAEVRAWVREAGAHARGYFNNVAAERKADRSWVTRADVEVEELLRERIAARYPGHGVIGEEQGVGDMDSEYVWCLDPIDGTGAFVAGLGTWCVSVGVLRRGQPHMGVIFLPMLEDCYWADAEGPAYRNDRPIAVSQATTIDSNDWIGVSSYAHRQFRIEFRGKTRSLSSVAADCCYVARGSSVGALIGRANLWDLAAGFALLRSAGAAVVGLSGAPVSVPDLLRIHKLPEPIVIAPPQLVETLRGSISRR
ncbi:MAG TPA: inositol monophosphatase family protein [Chloroflexaceae bacterium]|nr:inositol monophosphatase family protein [Chloroflexaceae bacterium]